VCCGEVGVVKDLVRGRREERMRRGEVQVRTSSSAEFKVLEIGMRGMK